MNEIVNLGNGQFVKITMLKGEKGTNIASVVKTGTTGLVDTYTITLTDGSSSTFTVTNGSSIESIEKTSTVGLVDTYTVTLTNGDTSTFTVTNGSDAQASVLPDKGTTVFQSDGSILTTFTNGGSLLVEFNSNGSISYTYEDDQGETETRTMTFNANGSITVA